jgi:Domain of unknown function (DUF4352)/Superinfection immunity protein
MIIFALLIYFLPTSLAAFRQRKSFRSILVVNLLAGWTGIGWLVALIWSLVGKRTAEPKPRSKAMSFALGTFVALGIISFPVFLANAPKAPPKQENTTASTSTAISSQTPVLASSASPSSPTQVASTPKPEASLVAVASSTPANLSPPATTPQPPKPITTPEMKPTGASENQRKIGEEFQLGDYTYRITGFRVTSKVGSGYSQESAEQGAKFVLVNFTIRNDSNKTQQVLADDFKIKDQQGREFSNDSKASMALLLSGGKKDAFLRQIQPGLTSQGATVFRVPADIVQQPMILLVPQKGAFFGKTVTVQLVK